MAVVRLVCLAYSRKQGERCLAGRSFVEGTVGQWIRPVSDQGDGEVPESMLQYDGGDSVGLMDILDVQVLGPRPRSHQRENWLLDSAFRPVQKGQVKWDQLDGMLDPADDLWVNGSHSYNGHNDRVSAYQPGPLNGSLRLIHVENLTLFVGYLPRPPGQPFKKGPPQVRAIFEYHGNRYNIKVTDPVCESKYRNRESGYGIRPEDMDERRSEYRIEECYIVVSLPVTPMGDYYYKLAAAILEHPEGNEQ